MTFGKMSEDYAHPSESFLRSIDIHDLLPQQEPFVMIGNLVHFDHRRTTTETCVSPANIFTEEGYFTAFGLIENIAQTCAARIGYVNKYILLRGIQIGFIGAVRNMQIHSLPHVGDTITTTVDVVEEVFGMTLATATVTCDGKCLVETEIKIALKEEKR